MGTFSFLSCCYAFRLCLLNKTWHVQFTLQNNLYLKAKGLIFSAMCQPSPYSGTWIWPVRLNCSNWKASTVICYVAWIPSSLLHPGNTALVCTNHSACQGRSMAHPCSGTHPMLDSFQKPGQCWGLRANLHTVMIIFSESINLVSVTSQTQRILIFRSNLLVFY